MRRADFLEALAATLLLAGCGSEAATRQPTPAETAALVSVAEAAPASVGSGALATGTVRAKRETALSFTSPGRVAAVLVDDGDTVARGQLLARLDPTPLTAASAAARAEAARAEAELKRLRELEKGGWIARPRLEAAQAAAVAARARVTEASFDSRFARIVAPTSGVVLRRHVEPNQTVAAGTPVVTIGEAAGGYVLRVPLPDAELPRLRLGQGASVRIAALGDRPLAATVTEIAARGDERTGTFDIELALPAAPGLRSGLVGTARIRTSGEGGAVAIPASAVFQARADEGFVYVVGADGRARARLIGLGDLTDREVVATRGLAVGERVVTSGLERVRDGGPVKMGRRG